MADVLVKVLFAWIACLLVAALAMSAQAYAQAAPMASPPNPPGWIKTSPTPPAILAGARTWATVDAAALAATPRDEAADILLVTGAWANLAADAPKRLGAKPDGERRLLIALTRDNTLAVATAAMAAGFDGIAVAASGLSAPAHGGIDALVADLRKRNPGFVILLDLGAALPFPDTALPHGDGLIVRHVLADARGAPYPDDEAAARLGMLDALIARNQPVLVAESAGGGASSELKDRLKALGAVPFVSPVP